MSTKLTLLSVVFFIIFSSNLKADNPTFEATTIYDAQKKTAYKSNSNLKIALEEIDKTFNNYRIIELNSQSIYKHLKTNNAQAAFNLKLKGVDLKSEDGDIPLNLTLHDVLSEDFKHYEQTENGIIVHQKPEVFTYRGFTNDPSERDVVLAIKNDWVSGYFTYQNERYFVNPIKQFDANYKSENSSISLVMYTADDSKHPSFECSVGKGMAEVEQPISKEHTDDSYKNSAVLQCAEIAVAYDQGFKSLHNGAQGVQNIIISRLNMVANLYTNWFEIDYKLTELYEAASNEITPDNNLESCQAPSLDCSENTILDDFQEWGEGQAEAPNFGNGFNSDPDVATFWTSRDIRDGNNLFNIGYSLFEGICNEKGYNICEDAVRYRGNEALQMTLWSHELGHTWNAYHTSSEGISPNNTFLMNSSVTAEAINVENVTVNAIVNHKNSRSCLDFGPCGSQHCTNGIQDADETDIDCGGDDCISCPTCNDGMLNGNEIGVDCGGPDCSVCPSEDCSIINFNTNPLLDYDPAQDLGTATVQGNGTTVLLENNVWKAIEINYNITSNTVLEFEFKSTMEGEIHDIGFDDNLLLENTGPSNRFAIYGNQGFCGFINDEDCTPYNMLGDWQSFVIPIGTKFIGNWQYLVLTADDDSGLGSLGNSYFRHIKIYEDYDGNLECGDCNDSDNDGICDTEDPCPDGPCNSFLSLKVLLQGATLNSPGLLMRDDLRVNNVLPLNEPYINIDYFDHFGNGGGETIEANLLADNGENSVVDWLLVELRDANDPSQIVETQSVLLQRDGTVIDIKGSEEITFNGIVGDYYVAIRHRNHLGVMTATPISLENNVSLDFTDINTPTWGISARVNLEDGRQGMWAGNSQIDNKLVFQGAENEPTAIFFTILQADGNDQSFPDYIAFGYYNSDVDMNGQCIFSGANNENNTVFFNVLTFPENQGAANFIIYEQLP